MRGIAFVPQTRLLRTSTFRYAVLYMVVFGVSVCGVLAFVYWSTVSVIDSQSDATIQAEIAGLEEQYAERGLLGLVEIIRARSKDETRRRGLDGASVFFIKAGTAL